MLKKWFIESIWVNNLCRSCGTCAGICPSNAIELERDSRGTYVPIINHTLCTKCALCIEVCPGHDLDILELNKFVFGKESRDPILGNYMSVYVGYSTDSEIRWNASSGGLVTTLLIYGLEKGLIDGAIVTRMSQRDPLEPEVILARSSKEVLSAYGSKYIPVPVNIALRQLSKEPGKFAIVGLPCHIHGIRKAEAFTKKLKDKIVWHFGLFCAHMNNFLGTEFVLQKLAKIKQKDVVKISYRGRGWPGGIRVLMRDGQELFIPHQSYWGPIFGSFFFTPLCCILCPDQNNELADISFGDAWLKEFRDDKIGTSLIISRSKNGEELVQDALRDGRIVLRKVGRDEVLRSQYDALYFKKRGLTPRRMLLKVLGKKIPKLTANLPKPTILDFLSSLLPFISICASSNPLLRRFLRRIPDSVLKLYSRLLWRIYHRASTFPYRASLFPKPWMQSEVN